MKQTKLVMGVGINDADYPVTKNKMVNGKSVCTWVCPFYSRWRNMLERAYSASYQALYPTYVGCSVCDDWIYFSNFKAWMQTQDWEGKHLDKDLLYPSNKVYSSETCVFIDQKINLFLTERAARRGDWPIGVSLMKETGKYQARCATLGDGQKSLGCYDTPEEAHKVWLKFKVSVAYELAAQQTDSRVAKALIERYENYENKASFYLETAL